jgi:citrate lyase subunit beta / citryl-CoA lyase
MHGTILFLFCLLTSHSWIRVAADHTMQFILPLVNKKNARSDDVQTWLFVPGNRADRIPKAVATQADRVIIDWEDSVAPGERASARRTTALALQQAANASDRCVIRINAAGTPDHRLDVDAVRDIRCAAVMLARTEHPDMLRSVTDCGLRVVALIESALGVEQAYAIASAPGVIGLAFGCVDYLADIQTRPSLQAVHYAQSRLVNAARAARLSHIVDGPTSALDDHEWLKNEALQARSLGMTAKMAIHPVQVQLLRQLFHITPAELQRARDIIDLYEEGLRLGNGVIRHGDQMIDGAVAKQARWLLDSHKT